MNTTARMITRAVSFLALMSMCLLTLAFVYSQTDPGPSELVSQQIQANLEAQIAKEPETEMERALDRTRDSTVAGFAAVAAVAASGDRAQVQIAQTTPLTVWGIVALVGLVIFLVYVPRPTAPGRKEKYPTIEQVDENRYKIEHRN